MSVVRRQLAGSRTRHRRSLEIVREELEEKGFGFVFFTRFLFLFLFVFLSLSGCVFFILFCLVLVMFLFWLCLPGARSGVSSSEGEDGEDENISEDSQQSWNQIWMIFFSLMWYFSLGHAVNVIWLEWVFASLLHYQGPSIQFNVCRSDQTVDRCVGWSVDRCVGHSIGR